MKMKARKMKMARIIGVGLPLLVGILFMSGIVTRALAQPVTQPASQQQHVVVPAYFPVGVDAAGIPNGSTAGDWQRIEQLGAGTIVVLDVGISAPGPGTPTPVADASVQKQIQILHQNHLEVIGYVATHGGTQQPDPKTHAPRTEQATQGYIDQWYNYYQPDGIFLDEGPDDPISSGVATYYTDIRAYMDQHHPNDDLMLNDASSVDEQVMQYAKRLNLVETPCTSYEPDQFKRMLPWLPKYTPDRISEVIWGCTSEQQMLQAVALSKDRGAGYLYVFDGTSSSYNHLPPSNPSSDPCYWPDELSAIANGAVTTQRPPVAAFIDPFGGTSINSVLWNNDSTPGASVTEANGLLVLQPTAAGLTSTARVRSTATYDLSGSSIFVHAAAPAAGAKQGTIFQLIYEEPVGDPARLIWYSDGKTAQAGYGLRGAQNNTPLGAPVTYDAAHSWWRIREDSPGGVATLYWEIGDGSTWTVVTSTSLSTIFPQVPVAQVPDQIKALKLELVATRFGPNPTPVAAQFASLNVLQGTTVTPTSTSTSVPPCLTVTPGHGATATPTPVPVGTGTATAISTASIFMTDTPSIPTATETSSIVSGETNTPTVAATATSEEPGSITSTPTLSASSAPTHSPTPASIASPSMSSTAGPVSPPVPATGHPRLQLQWLLILMFGALCVLLGLSLSTKRRS